MDPLLDSVRHLAACAFCSALFLLATSRGDAGAFGAWCGLIAVRNERERQAWSRWVRRSFVQRAGERAGGRPMEKTMALPVDLFESLCFYTAQLDPVLARITKNVARRVHRRDRGPARPGVRRVKDPERVNWLGEPAWR